MKKITLLLTVVLFISCGITKEPGTIKVSGTGSMMAAPDTASLSLTVSERAETTREAQTLANGKITEILSSLSEAGIDEKSIATSAIRFANDYIWNEETRRNEISGQIVSQTITVKFIDLNGSPSLLAGVLDRLGTIDGIEIGNLFFSINDPEKHYIEARRLAFEKAKQKADELASYGGLKLGRAVTIIESESGSMPYGGYAPVQRNVAFAEYDSLSPSEIPGGEISITYKIDVTFETK